MFNKFFNKTSQPKLEETATIEVTQEKKVEVAEVSVINSAHIQKDIHLSLDKVLEEIGINYTRTGQIESLEAKLKGFKEENKKLYTKIAALNDLGFVNTPSVKAQQEKLKHMEIKIKEDIQKVQADIIYYKNIEEKTKQYHIKYPSFKFIPTKVMYDILKKYNLFASDTCFYGKEIPDEAIEVAMSFKTEIDASKQIAHIVSTTSNNRIGSYDYVYYKVEIKPLLTDIQNMSNDNHVYVQEIDPYHRTSIAKSFNISKLKIAAPLSHFEIPTIDVYNPWDNKKDAAIPIVAADKNNCLIFNVDALNRRSKQLADAANAKQAVLDPILMLEVPDGFIILKAWDEEADIIEIQNGNLN